MIPRATMNRILGRLARAGLVVRRGRGVIAPAEVFDAGPVFDATDQAAHYLTQAAARLASAGVTGGDLCRWAEQRQRPPTAMAS